MCKGFIDDRVCKKRLDCCEMLEKILDGIVSRNYLIWWNFNEKLIEYIICMLLFDWSNILWVGYFDSYFEFELLYKFRNLLFWWYFSEELLDYVLLFNGNYLVVSGWFDC